MLDYKDNETETASEEVHICPLLMKTVLFCGGGCLSASLCPDPAACPFLPVREA